jgi:hypothetical protein
MHGIQRVAFLVNESRDSWEGLRSTLGLLVENLWAACFFIDTPVELIDGKSPEDFQENLEMLADLEGECFTNTRADADKYEFLTYASLEEMAEKIKTYHLVVPF